MQRFLSFGTHMRSLFGATVYKVNVDAGFTCPNRDGTLGVSGCIYCNNDSFRPGSCKPDFSVTEQVRTGISYIRRRYKAHKFIVYFQPFTNTYAPVAELEALYTEALEDPSVVGLAIGTRPDCVDEEKVGLLENLAKNKFILVEYGLQSMYDKSLEFIGRGHTYQTFLDALNLTRGRGIHIGAHLIAGFPTESEAETLAMAEEISALPIEFLKVHQLQIVRDTVLERMYLDKPFRTFGFEEYLSFIAEFLARLSPEVVIQRLFATAPDSILIAPQWGRNRQQIIHEIGMKLQNEDIRQGSKYMPRIQAG